MVLCRKGLTGRRTERTDPAVQAEDLGRAEGSEGRLLLSPNRFDGLETESVLRDEIVSQRDKVTCEACQAAFETKSGFG
jgi:hypothetical protein